MRAEFGDNEASMFSVREITRSGASPNVDRLFDKHLISFDDRGRLLLSDRASAELVVALGLRVDASISLNAQHAPYLAAHRIRMKGLDAHANDPFFATLRSPRESESQLIIEYSTTAGLVQSPQRSDLHE